MRMGPNLYDVGYDQCTKPFISKYLFCDVLLDFGTLAMSNLNVTCTDPWFQEQEGRYPWSYTA